LTASTKRLIDESLKSGKPVGTTYNYDTFSELTGIGATKTIKIGDLVTRITGSFRGKKWAVMMVKNPNLFNEYLDYCNHCDSPLTETERSAIQSWEIWKSNQT